MHEAHKCSFSSFYFFFIKTTKKNGFTWNVLIANAITFLDLQRQEIRNENKRIRHCFQEFGWSWLKRNTDNENRCIHLASIFVILLFIQRKKIRVFFYSINLFWSATNWIKFVNWHPSVYTVLPLGKLNDCYLLGIAIFVGMKKKIGNLIHKTGVTKRQCLIVCLQFYIYI